MRKAFLIDAYLCKVSQALHNFLLKMLQTFLRIIVPKSSIPAAENPCFFMQSKYIEGGD